MLFGRDDIREGGFVLVERGGGRSGDEGSSD